MSSEPPTTADPARPEAIAPASGRRGWWRPRTSGLRDPHAAPATANALPGNGRTGPNPWVLAILLLVLAGLVAGVRSNAEVVALGMELDAWFTLLVVLGAVGTLIFSRLSADIVLWGGVVVLLMAGVLSSGEALAGLSNEGMVTVGVLYIVVAGLRETGTVSWIVQQLLGRPATLLGAQARLMLPVTTLSAILNNTPVVAMLIPAVSDWARRNQLSASKLMIPLSYAAILGGTCTLIGTSTNLVVNGFLIREGMPGLGMFSIAWVGLPSALFGVAYILLFSRWLLPDRRPAIAQLNDPRQYTVEMLVEPGSPLVGKSIEKAGLRHLSGMYLIEIDRDGHILPAVGPHEILQANDRLVFAGVVESVVDLQKIRGLKPATNQVFKLQSERSDRCLIEAVVSPSCPLIGRSIREGRFRNTYNAVVIAAARDGERIDMKIGDIVIRPGDTLLLEAHPSFVDDWRNARDFFLLNRLEDSTPPRHERALTAGLILLGMVTVVTLEILPMLEAAMLAAALMLLSRCCTATAARRSIEWQLLLTIAASFGLGHALQTTGTAGVIASEMIGLSGGGEWLALAIVYLTTMLFTELITNNAAAVLMFPIALATSRELGVNFMPFAIAIMMAASASFSTPIGYQTNLMVYGPGGYRFGDYFRIGIPLNIAMCVITVSLAPMIWPFR
ncbi:SLC13 family permease [soil metagenome]